MNNSESNELQTRRRSAMAVLCRATSDEIAARLAAVDVPAHETLRDPESGLIMLRGRIGGDGRPFNFGEATVSRAAVRLAGGEVGFGYTLGRDLAKARLIALCDALIQRDDFADAIEAEVLSPLRARLACDLECRAQEAAATKVEFYTLVRGEA